MQQYTLPVGGVNINNVCRWDVISICYSLTMNWVYAIVGISKCENKPSHLFVNGRSNHIWAQAKDLVIVNCVSPCPCWQVQQGPNSDMMLTLAKNYRLEKERSEDFVRQKQEQANVVIIALALSWLCLSYYQYSLLKSCPALFSDHCMSCTAETDGATLQTSAAAGQGRQAGQYGSQAWRYELLPQQENAFST